VTAAAVTDRMGPLIQIMVHAAAAQFTASSWTVGQEKLVGIFESEIGLALRRCASSVKQERDLGIDAVFL
jgi:hypothetical protein